MTAQFDPVGAQESNPQAHRALVLHDSKLIFDLVELTLNHGLFVVRAATTLEEVDQIVEGWVPHVAVVDLEHPASEPFLRRLGASNTMKQSLIPILGLARRGDLSTKLSAFDRGVDDVLVVPFSPPELLARSMVIARRSSGRRRAVVATIRLGEMEIDIVNREVRTGTSVIHLTSLEQSLLYVLASCAGEVVTRDEILDAVWGTDFIAESNVVDRHIRSLRIKLQDDYRRPRFIETVSGKGYRFIPTFSNVGWHTTNP